MSDYQDTGISDVYDSLSRVAAHEYLDLGWDETVDEFKSALEVYLEDTDYRDDWAEIITDRLASMGVETALSGLRRIDPDKTATPRKQEGCYNLGV